MSKSQRGRRTDSCSTELRTFSKYYLTVPSRFGKETYWHYVPLMVKRECLTEVALATQGYYTSLTTCLLTHVCVCYFQNNPASTHLQISPQNITKVNYVSVSKMSSVLVLEWEHWEPASWEICLISYFIYSGQIFIGKQSGFPKNQSRKWHKISILLHC